MSSVSRRLSRRSGAGRTASEETPGGGCLKRLSSVLRGLWRGGVSPWQVANSVEWANLGNVAAAKRAAGRSVPPRSAGLAHRRLPSGLECGPGGPAARLTGGPGRMSWWESTTGLGFRFPRPARRPTPMVSPRSGSDAWCRRSAVFSPVVSRWIEHDLDRTGSVRSRWKGCVRLVRRGRVAIEAAQARHDWRTVRRWHCPELTLGNSASHDQGCP